MSKQNNEIDHRQVLLEWETLEFMPLKRGKTWYLVAGLIIFVLLTYATVSQSLTMALVFVMIAFLFMLIEHKRPRHLRAIVTDMGLEFDGNFFPYHHINAFWIVYHPPYVRTLYLRVKQGRRYEIVKVELNHMNPVELRAILIREIPEIEGADEPMIDILTRLLRIQ